MQNKEKLSQQDFLNHLPIATQSKLQEVVVLQEVDSTNNYLFSLDAPVNDQAIVCVSEHQSAGRGTKARKWHSQLGASLTYSIAWSFPNQPKDLSAITLAVGVVVQSTLESLGFKGIQLKWPNDLVADNKKLGGILVEAKQNNGACHLVCGIGINLLSSLDSEQIDTAFIALQEIKDKSEHLSSLPTRNILSAKLTEGLLELFLTYPETGFGVWRDKWQGLHCYKNKTISVEQSGQVFTGIALGVSNTGALLLQTDNEIKTIISAEIISSL